MSRRRTAGAGPLLGGLPRSLRAMLGGAVLIGSVRVIDAVWRRTTGRPTPVEDRTVEGDERAADPTVVRDRLTYALLLGAAAWIARRLGSEDGRA